MKLFASFIFAAMDSIVLAAFMVSSFGPQPPANEPGLAIVLFAFLLANTICAWRHFSFVERSE